MTNYSQAIMIVYEFNLNWPAQVQTALQYFASFSSAQEYVFSFDCIYKQLGLKMTLPTIYVEVMKYGLMPVFMSGIVAAVWYLIHLYRLRKYGKGVDYKQNITVTIFVIIYLVYPSISNLSFSLFNCFPLDDGHSYLKRDFSIQCWSGDHKNIGMGIALSFIIIWVLGFPAFIFYKLYTHRHKLSDKNFILKYGLFYVGLTERAFFWEVIVSNSRKIIFVICSTLLSGMNPLFKAILGVLAMFIQMQLLYWYTPYLDPRLDEIEHYGIYASILTVFAGLFFIQDDVQRNNDAMFALFLFILAANVLFLANWSYRFADVIFRTQVARMQNWTICSCLKKKRVLDYESDLREIIKKHESSSSSFSRRFIQSRLSFNYSGTEFSEKESFKDHKNNRNSRGELFIDRKIADDHHKGQKNSKKNESVSRLSDIFSDQQESYNGKYHHNHDGSGDGKKMSKKKTLKQKIESAYPSVYSHDHKNAHGQRASIFSTPELAFNDDQKIKPKKRNENIWERSGSLHERKQSSVKQKPKMEPLRLDKIQRPGNPNDKQYVVVPSRKESANKMVKKSNEMSKKSSSHSYPMRQEYTFNPDQDSPKANNPTILINGGQQQQAAQMSSSSNQPKKSILVNKDNMPQSHEIKDLEKVGYNHKYKDPPVNPNKKEKSQPKERPFENDDSNSDELFPENDEDRFRKPSKHIDLKSQNDQHSQLKKGPSLRRELTKYPGKGHVKPKL